MDILDLDAFDLAAAYGGPVGSLIPMLDHWEIIDNDAIISYHREAVLDQITALEEASGYTNLSLAASVAMLMDDRYNSSIIDHRVIVADEADTRLFDVSELFPERSEAYVIKDDVITEVTGQLSLLRTQLVNIADALMERKCSQPLAPEYAFNTAVTRIIDTPGIEVADIEIRGVYSNNGKLMGIEITADEKNVAVLPLYAATACSAVVLLVSARNSRGTAA